MIPRCGSCKWFSDKNKSTDNVFKVIFRMRILIFDGFCQTWNDRYPKISFFFSLRNKDFTCREWKWRGRKKNESDIDQATGFFLNSSD